MCMGCATNADFLVTSGILGAASLRVAARRVLPTTPRWARKVSDEEAAGFVSSLQPVVDATEPATPADDHLDEPRVLADR
jgi:hypothetical protein